MEKIVMNLETAKRAIDNAIEIKGEKFIYEQDPENQGCAYVHPGSAFRGDEGWHEIDWENATPGCIVGQGLISLGLKPEDFREENLTDAANLVRQFAADGLIESYEQEALIYLLNVQTTQDNGYSWGRARELANEGKHINAAHLVSSYDDDDI